MGMCDASDEGNIRNVNVHVPTVSSLLGANKRIY